MSVSANTLGLLIKAGLSGDVLIEVVMSIDADSAKELAQKEPSAAAIRQKRYRERLKSKRFEKFPYDTLTRDSAIVPPQKERAARQERNARYYRKVSEKRLKAKQLANGGQKQ